MNISLVCAVALALSGCAGVRSPAQGPSGTLSGKLIVQWAGENRFIYLPDEHDPLTFVSADQKKIIPEAMYTDGGSIPPVFWSAPGFSPWGYGPAYIIHDWLFEQHHCKYSGWADITFDDSARILGEVIDTLMKKGDVPSNAVARQLIELGVRTETARRKWNEPKLCNPPPKKGIGSGRSAPAGPIILRIDFSTYRPESGAN